MGQGCSGHVTDVASDPTNQDSSTNNNGPQVGNVLSKADTLWRQTHASRIHGLLGTLGTEDVQHLLALYRSKSFHERSRLLTSSTQAAKPTAAPLVHLHWRRIALNDQVLFSLFPSLHTSTIRAILEGVSAHVCTPASSKLPNTEHQSRVHWNNVMSKLRMVDRAHLMRAFHCASYLYNPVDAVDTSIGTNNADLVHSSPPSAQASFKLSNSVLNLSTNNLSNGGTSGNGTSGAAANSVGTPTELLVRDFLFALALCKNGTYLEQLSFLFVLFAEPAALDTINTAASGASARPIAVQQSNSAANVGGFSAEPAKPATAADPGVAGADASGGNADQDGIMLEMSSIGGGHGANSAANTAPHTPVKPATNNITTNATTNSNSNTYNNTANAATSPGPLLTAKSRMFSFAAPKPMVVDKTLLQRLELNETCALKMWLFLQLMLLRVYNPTLSVVCSANSNNSKYGGVDVSGVVWSDSIVSGEVYTTLLQYAELLTHTSSIGTSSRTLSYPEFIKLCHTARHTQTLPEYSAVDASAGIFEVLQRSNVLSPFNVGSALGELVCDVLPSSGQIQQLSRHLLSPHSSAVQSDLLQCLAVLNTDQFISRGVRSSFEVFLLDARWFLEWCRLNKLTPIFHSTTAGTGTSTLTTINTSIVYNSSSTKPGPNTPNKKKRAKPAKVVHDTSAAIRHLLVGLVPVVEGMEGGNGENGTASTSGNTTTIPPLHNATLLYKDALGVYRLKPTDQVAPYIPSANSKIGTSTESAKGIVPVDGAGDKTQYVILPYVLGRSMYEYYDAQSQYIAASVYRRVLRIGSTARPVPTAAPTSTTNTTNTSSVTSGKSSANNGSVGDGGFGVVDPPTRDELQALGPTATQLVRNFQSVNSVFLSPQPPLVPLYMCTVYGTCSVAPIDTLCVSVLPPASEHEYSVCSVSSTYGVYSNTTGTSTGGNSVTSTSVDMLTLQDLILHTSSALIGPDINGIEYTSGKDNCVCRLWGLYNDTTAYTVHAPAMQHTTNTVWRLLTSTSSDYTIPLCTLFSSSSDSGISIKTHSLQQQHLCMGLMIEYTTAPYTLHNTNDTTVNGIGFDVDGSANTDRVTSIWPTDRILHAQGHTRAHPTTIDSTTSTTSECPFFIAEHVDVLNNNNQWCVGVVTNIAREVVPTKHDSNNVVISVTVRPLVDSDSSAVVSKVVKRSGVGVRSAAHSNNQEKAAASASADINTAEALVNSSAGDVSAAGSGIGDQDSSEGVSERGSDEGSDEGSVESAIQNNRTANSEANAFAAGEATVAADEEEGSEEESGSESEEEDEEDSLRALKRKTANKTATGPVSSSAANGTSANSSNVRPGVTWQTGTSSGTNGPNTGSNSSVIVVLHTSLRILDLGTVTNPTIHTINTGSGVSYHRTVCSNLYVMLKHYSQHQQLLYSTSMDSTITNTNTSATEVPNHTTTHNTTHTRSFESGQNSPNPRKNSFFNSPAKGSVTPYNESDNAVTNTYDGAHGGGSSDGGSEIGAEVVKASSSGVISGGVGSGSAECSVQLSSAEWGVLVKAMANIATCPFPLRALYVLLISEQVVLLPRTHHYKCVVQVTSGLYCITAHLHPTVQTEYAAAANDDTNSHTSNATSLGTHYTHTSHRNPLNRFFKNCSKSFQHKYAHRDIVSQSDLTNQLQTNNNSTYPTNNNNSNIFAKSDAEGEVEPSLPHKSVRGDYFNTSASSVNSHANTINNGASNFPNQHHNNASLLSASGTTATNSAQHHNAANTSYNRPIGGTIAKPSNNPSAGTVGIRIVGVAGLNNLGNTCFMSASLQCLFRTTPLVNYFLTRQYKLDINSRSALGSKGRLTEEFAKFLQLIFTLPPVALSSVLPPSIANNTAQHTTLHLINSTTVTTTTTTAPPARSLLYTSYSPTSLLKVFQAHKPQFVGADQQDSQEFLCELLDSVHEDCKVWKVNTGSVVSGDSGGVGSSGVSGGSSSSTTNPIANSTSVAIPGGSSEGGGDSAALLVLVDTGTSPLKISDNMSEEMGSTTNPAVPLETNSTTTAPIDATTNAINNTTSTTNHPTTNRERSGSTISLTRHNSLPLHPLPLPMPLTSSERTLTIQELGHRTWSNYIENNTSIVTNLFQGQMCSKVVCNVCNTSSANFEPFTTLSMPIPRINASAVQHNELTTVFITVYRKMPRLSRILHLPDSVFDRGRLTASQLVALYQSTRNPVKLALSFPRTTTVESVLHRALGVYNNYEMHSADAAVGNSGNGGNGGNSGNCNSSSGIGNSGAGANNENNADTTEEEQHTPLSRSPCKTHIILNNGNGNGNTNYSDVGGREGAFSAKSGKFCTSSQRRTKQNNSHESADLNGQFADGAESNAPETESSADNTNSTYPNTPVVHGVNNNKSNINSVQPLLVANTVVIDVNDKVKGRYGKMLDKRDTLQALLDENTNECHLVLQERVKDIAFVANLQASRLSQEYIRHTRPQLLTNTANPTSTAKNTTITALLDYFDAHEYDTAHILSNDSHSMEGPLVADFDYTYDPATLPKSSGGSLSAMIKEHADRNASHINGNTSTASTSTSTRSKSVPLRAHISTNNTNHTYTNTKPYPTALEYFQIGDRVDCLDYKGTWYSGSVIDILDLTEKDIKTFQLTRFSRDFMTSTSNATIIRPTSSTTTAAPATVNGRVLCTAGVHMRVHFDGFKGNWDEWYDQRDFEHGLIAPAYSHATRRMKMHEIPVMQRRLVYNTESALEGSCGQGTQAGPSPGHASGPANNNTKVSLSIELLDTPSFVQGESYRSCMHLYNHIHEQMLRYVDDELLMQTLQVPVGHDNQPFSIRLISYDNPLIAPVDTYCPVTTTTSYTGGRSGAEAEQSTAPSSPRVVTSSVCPGLEFSIGDRFFGHKNWEGSAMPMDVCRPIHNIYHNKLAIAVDWVVLIDNTTTGTTGAASASMSGNSVYSNGHGVEAERAAAATPVSTAIAAGLLHDAMVCRHEPSYTHYLALLRERQQILQHNEVKAREQQQREQLAKDRAGTSSGGTGGTGNSRGAHGVSQPTPHRDKLLEAYHSDLRNGLTIEEVLGKFVHSEDLDEYYCNTCKKQTPGKLHSSIHTLPDVLILHLQRLVMNGTGGNKIRTLVKFPLSLLDMRPFTTEQKELVAGLAERAASGEYSSSDRSSGAETAGPSVNTDLYELYGVVNHIGGMNGGHYTALSKVEDVILTDVLRQRCGGGSGGGSGASIGGKADGSGGKSVDGVCYDDVDTTVDNTNTATKLSISEFISASTSSSTNTAHCADDGSNSAATSSNTSANNSTSRWLKFDDEFVNVVPPANLHTSVVTESAVLLFYQRKQMSNKNLVRYL